MSRTIRSRIEAALRRPAAPKLIALAFLIGATAVAAQVAPATTTAISPPRNDTPVVGNVAKPRIEAVFVLDTTGSMDGLIEGAKQKIWTLASEMANAQNRPEIRMGLVAYRDRGDAYVTRRFDLSPDLDALSAELHALVADGGGDGPESVNQALHEAVTQMAWSKEPNVYRVLFLVGDAPPHMDYPQDVPFTQTVVLARQRGIVINTIQCGVDGSTAAVWQEIAGLAQGHFAAIAQDGAMIALATPVDDELARLNAALSETVLPYGGAAERRALEDKVANARMAPAPSAASRLSYLEKSGGKVNSGRSDLVDALKSGEVDLAAIPEAELPSELQALEPPARGPAIAAKRAERERIQGRISELVKQRDAFLETERAKRKAEGSADAFDDKVLESVKEQAAAQGIRY
jgi:hypothetical protein